MEGEIEMSDRINNSSNGFLENENEVTYTETFPIPVDEAHFPDEKFREYIKKNISDSGFLTKDVIDNTKIIDVSIKDISDLTGIAYFVALEKLDCSINLLTSLDVSKNAALKNLNCGHNQLTSLNVSKNLALEKLLCWSNQITSLDVSKNLALEELSCRSNQLTSLDVSKNTVLKNLECYHNLLTSLDVSKNLALEELLCWSNQLTSLDVSKNAALKNLDCNDNQLTSLDLSKNLALEDLSCSHNRLTSLDLNNNIDLVDVCCDSNQITSLEISNIPDLCSLRCHDNKIDRLYLGETGRPGGNFKYDKDVKIIYKETGEIYQPPINLDLIGFALPVLDDGETKYDLYRLTEIITEKLDAASKFELKRDLTALMETAKEAGIETNNISSDIEDVKSGTINALKIQEHINEIKEAYDSKEADKNRDTKGKNIKDKGMDI